MKPTIYSLCTKAIAAILLLSLVCLLCACDSSKEKTHSGDFAGSAPLPFENTVQENMP